MVEDRFNIMLFWVVFAALLVVYPAGEGYAQLQVAEAGVNYTIDFDNTVNGVNSGQFSGSGFEPGPATGRLDSDAWASSGMSDGNSSFGGTHSSGDFARGISPGGVSTGGFYGFLVNTGDQALGIQPGADDWTPGTLTLRMLNNTGAIISTINLSYAIHVRNDADRSNTFNFSYSHNNSNYVHVPLLDYTSPSANSGTNWITIDRSATLTDLAIPNDAYFYLRWWGDDAGGSGSRDEFALNDIVLSVLTVEVVEDPQDFQAVTFSQSQINLSWTPNLDNDHVMLAWSSSGTFGAPSGAYPVNGNISGGGTVLYTGPATSYSHTGLSTGLEYFYKAWSVDENLTYSNGITTSGFTVSQEPGNHPANLMAALLNGPATITVSWMPSDANKYLIKGNDSGFDQITAPQDGTLENDGHLTRNASFPATSGQFTGLTPGTPYYFRIYPYNGIGDDVDYKTDGAIPQACAKTKGLDIPLIISEVADPLDSALAKFVEVSNIGETTIDFSTTAVYLCRQADGGNWGSVQLSGTLAPGTSHVIAYQSARFFNAYGFNASQNSGNVSGNGNDGYFLYYGGNQTSGLLLDAYGVIDENGNGQPWYYADRHAVRKRTVSTPKPTWDPCEWVILPANVSDMTPAFHKGDVTWLGASSVNWNEKGANWNSPNGYVPDASCIVTIPAAAIYPVVTRSSACHLVHLQTGTSLSIQGPGMLQVAGQ